MKDPQDYLAFDLNVFTRAEAQEWHAKLDGIVSVMRVGVSAGLAVGLPSLIDLNRKAGFQTLFDFRIHDIPSVVEKTMNVIAGLGVRYATFVTTGTASEVAALAGAKGRTVPLALCGDVAEVLRPGIGLYRQRCTRRVLPVSRGPFVVECDDGDPPWRWIARGASLVVLDEKQVSDPKRLHELVAAGLAAAPLTKPEITKHDHHR